MKERLLIGVWGMEFRVEVFGLEMKEWVLSDCGPDIVSKKAVLPFFFLLLFG